MVQVDAIDYRLAVLGYSFCCGAVEFSWKTATVVEADGGPEAVGEFVAGAAPDGVALVLRVPEAADAGKSFLGVVAEKESAGYWEIYRADDIGITDVTIPVVPVRDFDLPFCAVDVGFGESNRETDAGVEELIVVEIIVHAAIKNVYVEAELAEEAFGYSRFVIISIRRLDWKAQKGIWIQRSN